MKNTLAKEIFISHEKRIKDLLDGKYIAITHVGGTSFPGAITKGDVDIVVQIAAEEMSVIQGVLEQEYIIKNPEIWTDDFCVFKYEDSLPVDLIIVVKGTEYDKHLIHQKILLENPDLLAEYNELKIKLLVGDPALYRQKKYEFFKKLNN